MKNSTNPVLYQINTRVWLTELKQSLGRLANLDDIPDADLDHIAKSGFEWVWMLSVWQTGKAGQRVSRNHPGWMNEFQQTLPDLKEEDIEGSGFAITRYVAAERLGGNDALARFRKRLADRGLRMMLDFVPNHTAMDHEWIREHPDFYVQGGEKELMSHPENYFRRDDLPGSLIVAHGRDPFFPGWADTAQLNYGNPALQQAMREELEKISQMCDGVRCDMAMLVLPEVFLKTWDIRAHLFWPDTIQAVRKVNREFCFMAEVYWDMEWTLLQQGFDYTYDKRLYDRLKEGEAAPVREHLLASPDYQGKMARFLENHDEQRAAVEFSAGMHEAAALITFLTPGMRFFHQGQLEGRKKKISAHLVRAPQERIDERIKAFYDRLMDILRRPIFRSGHWKLLDCLPAWQGNKSHLNYICFSWDDGEEDRIIVAVNYAWHDSQCYIRLPFSDLSDNSWSLHDLLSDLSLGRDGSDLKERGLYLDEPGWKSYVFLLTHDRTEM